MSTRLYPLSAGTSPLPGAAASGQWDDMGTSGVADSFIGGGAARRLPLVFTSGSTAGVSVTSEETLGSTSSGLNTLIAQFVGPPMEAQTLGGTLTGQMRMKQSDLAGNLYPQMTVRVLSGDGAIVRGALRGSATGSTPPTTDELTVTLQNTRNPITSASPLPLNSVVCQSGDRPVVEVGFRALNVSATNQWARLVVGGAGVDLSAGGTETAGTPWIEFSQDIIWLTTVASAAMDARDTIRACASRASELASADRAIAVFRGDLSARNLVRAGEQASPDMRSASRVRIGTRADAAHSTRRAAPAAFSAPHKASQRAGMSPEALWKAATPVQGLGELVGAVRGRSQALVDSAHRVRGRAASGIGAPYRDLVVVGAGLDSRWSAQQLVAAARAIPGWRIQIAVGLSHDSPYRIRQSARGRIVDAEFADLALAAMFAEALGRSRSTAGGHADVWFAVESTLIVPPGVPLAVRLLEDRVRVTLLDTTPYRRIRFD